MNNIVIRHSCVLYCEPVSDQGRDLVLFKEQQSFHSKPGLLQLGISPVWTIWAVVHAVSGASIHACSQLPFALSCAPHCPPTMKSLPVMLLISCNVVVQVLGQNQNGIVPWVLC